MAASCNLYRTLNIDILSEWLLLASNINKTHLGETTYLSNLPGYFFIPLALQSGFSDL